MKVIPFTIPVPADSSVHVQHEQLPHFYEHLHRHKEIQLTWIKSGTGTLLAGNYISPFEEGDLYLLGAQLPHVFKSDPAYFKKKKGMTVEAYSIFFDPSGPLKHLLSLPEMATVLRWMNQWSPGCKISPKMAPQCSRLMVAVCESQGVQRLSAFIDLLKHLSSGKKHLALSSDLKLISDAEGQRMNAVIQFTMKHFAEQVSIESVAQEVHMTPPAFCRYFKKHTRKTYITFLNELRIQEACKLLQQNGRENIGSIAWETGFNHVSNFNRVFKKVMGESPGGYWKRVAEL